MPSALPPITDPYIVPEKVLLVGGVPLPGGGVTQHVWRLALELAGGGCGVCDLYPGAGKYPTPGVALRVAPLHCLQRLPWLWRQIARTPAKIIHFHASRPHAVAVYGPLLWRAGHGRYLMLTLHHGDQRGAYRAIAPALRRVVRSSLRKFDRLVALSAAQRDFYEREIGIASHRIYEADSHIALPFELLESMPVDSAVIDGSYGEELFIVSGYAAPYYRHEDAVRLVDELRAERDIHLAICLYGQQQYPEYLAHLRELAAERPHIHLVFDLGFPTFVALLRRASLLLRPTTVDSYGLAVADAILLGVPVVASDVCRRHPGADVFRAGDYEAFREKVLAVLACLPDRKRRLAEQHWNSVASPAVAAYNDLLV
jgi:glycosyltransferase involved in cell wall biosynthesis